MHFISFSLCFIAYCFYLLCVFFVTCLSFLLLVIVSCFINLWFTLAGYCCPVRVELCARNLDFFYNIGFFIGNWNRSYLRFSSLHLKECPHSKICISVKSLNFTTVIPRIHFYQNTGLVASLSVGQWTNAQQYNTTSSTRIATTE